MFLLEEVPIMKNGIETIQTETVYSINDFPYADFRKEQKVKNKKGITYYNISASFDIESTTIDGRKIRKGKIEHYIDPPQGFMYQWQFAIKDKVCFGRTWEEFTQFIENIRIALELYDNKILVVYVHFLSYEFQFMKDFFQIESIFATEKRKILKMNTIGIEFRCSYMLSNMSLAKFCENSRLCSHYKMKDTYDYKKLRTPKTPLTNEEMAYCYNDVRGLNECIDTLLLEDDILSIPITNTGYVRREFRQAMRTKENRRLFEKIQLNVEEYNILRKAFRGGNTHANRMYSNKILPNVYSYDIQSSYPAMMMLEEFPMGKFTRVTLDTQEKLDLYTSKYCVVMTIEMFDITVKENVVIPYLDIAHCSRHSNIENDNGRVLSADYVEITLTNLDLDIIRENYNFTGLRVLKAEYARKGKLPKEFREKLLHFYTLKTELKDIDGKEYEYMKSKNRVNSSYGMMVTAIDHSEIDYNAETHDWTENFPEVEKALFDYYKNRNNFLCYQWGVWVTALARTALQKMISKIGIDVIYVDTDSVKFINRDNCKYFEEENKRIIQKVLSNDIKAYATDKEGIDRYLGIWDYEGSYIRFKTLGAKKYCFEKYNKKKDIVEFKITVSGMSKEKGARAVGTMENFNIGQVYHDIGRTTSWYNESDIKQITVNGDTFTTASNIAVLETTYELGVTNEYYEILSKYIDVI